jgi:hypothetical protein
VADAGTAPIYYRWSSLARAKYIEPAWQFLSNMSPFPVTIGGIVYPTLEHYYHVMVLLLLLLSSSSCSHEEEGKEEEEEVKKVEEVVRAQSPHLRRHNRNSCTPEACRSSSTRPSR